MGFDKYSSIYTFFIGTINTLNFMNNDNLNFKENNQITGKVFLVLFALKLFEYFMWFDDKCEYGINETANIMGSIIDNMIPSLIFFLFTIKNKKFNNTLSYINAIYLFYVIYNYIGFIKNDELCTDVKPNQTIVYGWNDNFNFIIYLIMLAINVFSFYSPKNKHYVFISFFVILLINKIKKWDNIKIFGIISSITPYILEQIQN